MKPKHQPICKCGWAATNYCEKYDSWYCPICGEWVESVCRDPDCEFCKDRPDRPLKEWYVKGEELWG